MYKDKEGNDIVLGSVIRHIIDGVVYVIVSVDNKLYADNGGNRFPLDSVNWDLKKFILVNDLLAELDFNGSDIICDWMMCRYNASNEYGVAGKCVKRKVKLGHFDDGGDMQGLDCKDFANEEDII